MWSWNGGALYRYVFMYICVGMRRFIVYVCTLNTAVLPYSVIYASRIYILRPLLHMPQGPRSSVRAPDKYKSC